MNVQLIKHTIRYVVFLGCLFLAGTVLTYWFNGGDLNEKSLPSGDLLAEEAEFYFGDLPVENGQFREDPGLWVRDLSPQNMEKARRTQPAFWLKSAPQLQTMRDPVLLIRGIKQYEVFVNGKSVYRYQMDEDQPERHLLYPLEFHMMELPKTAPVASVAIRIYNDIPYQLFTTNQLVMIEKETAIREIFLESVVKLLVAVIFIFAGTIGLAAYVSNRKQPVYLYFAIMNFSSAFGALAACLLIHASHVASVISYWRFVTFPLTTFAFIGFIEQIFGSGYRGLHRILRYALALTTLAVIVMAWFKPDWYGTVLPINYKLVELPVMCLIGFSLFKSSSLRLTGTYEWSMFGIAVIIVLTLKRVLAQLYPQLDSYIFDISPLFIMYWNRDLIYVGQFVFILCMGFVLIRHLNDIHTRVNDYADRLQSQNVRLQELDRLKDEFLANTSHELRTPLHGIIGITESLLDGVAGSLPQAARNNLAVVMSSGQRLSRLIDDILDFSKLKHRDVILRPSSLHLYPAVALALAALEPIARKKGLALINEVGEQTPPVIADENRLQQMLYNLIGNAVKFTEKGFIRLAAHTEESTGGAWVVLTVADSGIGLSPEQLELIFEPFEQADSPYSSGGTGLGLSITRKLAELHGGRLSAVSEAGAGSTFSLALPAAAEAAPVPDPESAPPVKESAAGADLIWMPDDTEFTDHMPAMSLENDGPLILVVDDEPINLRVVANFLLWSRFRVATASGGKEAIRLIEELGPDLVLLDVMMADLNGYDVCREVRRTRNAGELPIVLLTAKRQPADVVQGFDAGASDYLSKPITRRELLARVHVHLELTRLNHSLEELVLQRTTELEETHRQLQASMRETFEALGEVAIYEERNRIAHDIHDILGHRLTGAALQLEAVKRLIRHDPDNALSKLESALHSVRGGLEDVRSAVRMMKDDIRNGDLEQSIRELAEDTEELTGATVDMQFGTIPTLDAMQKKVLYHAFQEGLTNGLKHGSGKQFRFRLASDNRMLTFRLWNDGAPYMSAPYGFGLTAMKERILHLGGSIKLDSSVESGGTELLIEIPIKDE
ncbi:ATP-binding protein [Paenibacillus hamazuiensis]|uniref:ATP-binding protein n=1 Tax=Paenibacillus hamazuiensis TaxID=2936508 RepID=UPI00200F582C|nr:ATP-binding protein [Paenibacillus hamazuiensis]